MAEPVLDILTCPVCRSHLSPGNQGLHCLAGHSFDRARQGYVNLRSGRRGAVAGDTADMLADRAGFLGAGYYAPIADSVTASVAAGLPATPGERPVVLDVGAGPGYYLARVLDAVPSAWGVAMDVSTPALRRAARAHPRAAAIGADAWSTLPIRDGSVAAVTDIFAPRNVTEFHRVLRPGGCLVVVTPAAEHLTELVETFGLISVDENKERRLDEVMSGWFTAERSDELRYSIHLDRAAAEQLIGMGPSAFHLTAAERASRLLAVASPLRVTISVHVTRFRPAIR